MTLARLAHGFSVDVVELLTPADLPPKRGRGRPRKRTSET
jgi:hypothetical protein